MFGEIGHNPLIKSQMSKFAMTFVVHGIIMVFNSLQLLNQLLRSGGGSRRTFQQFVPSWTNASMNPTSGVPASPMGGVDGATPVNS